jgi:putative endonuclease
MYYVYVLRSLSNSKKTYIGYTVSIDQRLVVHNEGQSIHTAKHRPWELLWYGAFVEEEKAIAFEKYLKIGSGKALVMKRLI